MEFTTAKRREKAITFRIDGDDYAFTPPKQAPLLLDFLSGGTTDTEQTRAAFDWLGEGLPDDQEERLIARLRDPKDDFDLPNLKVILDWLTEQVGGRPTT
jgi:hypothetical protein